MPTWLLIIAGLLLILNPGWFTGAMVIGIVLLAIGVISTLIALIAGGFIISLFKDTW